MKKHGFLITLSLAVVLMALCFFVLPTETKAATEYTEGGFTYTVYNGEATVTRALFVSADMTIPSTLGGYPVTSIGEYAFYECESLTSITIPDCVTTIRGYAFGKCKNLTNVTGGDGVAVLDYGAFSECDKLQADTLFPNAVTGSCGNNDVVWTYDKNKGVLAFSGNGYIPGPMDYYSGDDRPARSWQWTNAKKLIIEDGIIEIGASAFVNFDSLETVVLGASVKGFYPMVFMNCINLKSIYCNGDAFWFGGFEGPNGSFKRVVANLYYPLENTTWSQNWVDTNNEEWDDLSGITLVPYNANGWNLFEGKWYYYKQGVEQTGWKQVNGYWYYFESNGVMAANAWKKDSKGWCYLGANGAMMKNAWVQDSKGWCYVGADGYCLTNQWAQDSKGWIWLDSNGSMTKSKWIQYKNVWYYLDSEGYMATGWLKYNNVWYYMGTDGKMTTGWAKVNNNWYYLGTNGVMTTGWQKVNNTWYYMASNGVMTTGWQKVNNNWYYLGTNGAMVTGWVQIGSTWYYLHSSGVMATGTVKIGAKTYTFASNGVWIS